jgi:hypothetical protein
MNGRGKVGDLVGVGVREGVGEVAAVMVVVAVGAVTGSVILPGCMMGSRRQLRVPAAVRCRQRLLVAGLA